MPALGDTAAQPLRFMDFLIYEPVRAVLLHGDGIPVLVPAPERYAVHKLIVSSQRLTGGADGTAKRDKDLQQSANLIEALEVAPSGPRAGRCLHRSLGTRPNWRAALRTGIGYLPTNDRQLVEDALARALSRVGSDYRELLAAPKPAA